MKLLFTKLSVLFIIITALLLKLSLAAYISLGGSLGGNANKGSGSAIHFGAGVFSYKKYSISVTNTIGIYGLSYNPYSWYNKNLKDKLADSNVEAEDLIAEYAPVLTKTSIFAASYLNLEYDPFKTRGFYYFAGIGYGIQVSFRPEASKLANILPQISNLTSLTPNEIVDLSANPQFQQDIIDAIGPLTNLFLSLYGSNYPGLINQLNILQNNPNLINNPETFNQWLTDTADSIGNLGSGSTIDKETIDPDITKAIFDNIIRLQKGIAWQLGAGYDLKILGPLGLDFQGKIQGLFVKPIIPVYNLGVNIIIKW